MAPKSKQISLPLKVKLEIIDKLEKGHSAESLASLYGCSVQTVSVFKRKKNNIRALAERNLSPDVKSSSPVMVLKSGCSPKEDKLDKACIKFLEEQRDQGIDISGAELRTDAETIAKELGFADFKASDDLMRRFRHRHGLSNHCTGGKSASISVGIEDAVDIKFEPEEDKTPEGGTSLVEKDLNGSLIWCNGDAIDGKDGDTINIKQEYVDDYHKTVEEEASIQDLIGLKQEMGNEYEESIDIKEEFIDPKPELSDAKDRRGDKRARSRSPSPVTNKRRPDVSDEDGGERNRSAALNKSPEASDDEIDRLRTKEKQPTGTIKEKRYGRRYCTLDENEPLFKNWVKPSSRGDTYAYCIACDCHFEITAGKTDLKRHCENDKHFVNARSMHSQNKFTEIVSAKFCDDISNAELRLAAAIVEHDLPIVFADHLSQLIKAVCSDSKIADDITFCPTKASSLINHVTGEENLSQLIEHLRKNAFSLIVDETTDKSCVKHLCMVVRVLVEDSVNDVFLGLIPFKDATANTLYNHLLNFFNEHEIPYKDNMIGFAADDASTMLCAHDSLSSLLKKDIPHLFVMKCICHSFALCAAYACFKLPQSIEDLARDIYNYFPCSPKCVGEFDEFQMFANVKPYKLLHPSQTRWLSLHMVVSRLLEQYDALTLYFTNAVLVDKLTTPETILQRLNDPVTKLYLMFLDFVLPIFNNLNKRMQAKSTQVHLLHGSVSSALTTLLECYLRESYVKETPLMKVRFRDPGNFKPLEEIYLGLKVGIQLRNTDSYEIDDLKTFRFNCLEFLMEAVSQIYKRYSFDSLEMESLKALSPRVVIDRKIASLVDLLTCFGHLTSNIQHVDTEWRLLASSLVRLDLNPRMHPEEFWSKVASVRQVDDSYMFPNLSKLMQTLLCLPYSSASVESIFSSVNRMKTKSRNRLSIDTLIGLLHTKQSMKGKSCFDFCITNSLVEKTKSVKCNLRTAT